MRQVAGPKTAHLKYSRTRGWRVEDRLCFG